MSSTTIVPATRNSIPNMNRSGVAQNAATIALSTNSPLIAKYMNLNSNQNLNITDDSKTSKVLTTFTTSNTPTTTTTTTTTIVTPSPTKPPLVLGSALNPDGYLSAKLNQNRVAREAFLRSGGNSITTINSTVTTTMSNSTSCMPNQSQTMNSSVASEKSSPSLNTSQLSLNTTTTVKLNNNNNNNSGGGGGGGIGEKTANLIAALTQKPSPTYSSSNSSSPITAESSSQLYQNLMPTMGTYVAPSSGNDPSLSLTCIKTRTLDGYVGFANLPNQVYRKSVKKGFEFNLMIIGETGLGKSTFINSLFLTELYNPADFPGTHERKKKTTHVDSTSVMLSEKGVNLRLTIVDTPGFGESVDNTNCWQPIVDHLDSKYEEYLAAESRVNRKPLIDNRVHCCLYFIAPGHSLKQLDIEVMKKLHDRVNLIPIIAKADTMTLEEIKAFKKVVLNEINQHKIQIYEFPDVDDDDVEMSKTNSLLKSKLPFAIVGSNTIIDVDGRQCRGRQYPWGLVNIDDLNHCDFMALRTMLVRTHMQDLKDVTNNVHYENYRFKKLAQVTGDKSKLNTSSNKNPFQQLEEERKEAESRLDKMKSEMEAVFEQKVKEKLARLKESEANLEKQQETMRATLEREEKELEAQRVSFQREKQLWEEQNRDEEEKLKLTLDKELDKKKKKIF